MIYNLDFQPVFDTFVERGSVKGYRNYKELPDNAFSQDTKFIVLYVELMGFDLKETIIVDEYNIRKTLYSYKFRTSLRIVSNEGNIVAQTPPFYSNTEPTQFDEKPTKVHTTIELNFYGNPIPIGEHMITFTVTDVVSGKSFDIKKDIKVVA
jgi:hypothetical protein